MENSYRNKEKTIDGIRKIKQTVPGASSEFIELDLASLNSVRSFTKQAINHLFASDRCVMQ